jgi:hypothetical protein
MCPLCCDAIVESHGDGVAGNFIKILKYLTNAIMAAMQSRHHVHHPEQVYCGAS